MAIDDNTSYELTGYQVKDLAQKIRAKADSNSLAAVATSGLYSDLTGAPSIPTVYNGTLTIQQNGTTLGTFSANQDTNATINITGGGGGGTTVVYMDYTAKKVYSDSAKTTLLTAQDVYNLLASGCVLVEIDGTYRVMAEVNDDDSLNAVSFSIPWALGGTSWLVCGYRHLTDTTFVDEKTNLKYTAGTNISISNNVISATNTTYSDFTGATSSTAGAHGLVPAPASGDQEKVLHGDGTWKDTTAKLVEMSYGESNAWAKFIAAYNAGSIVYCRASSSSDPSSGSQTRKAFMAYVNNATSPTSVEFQYVRSVSSKSDSQQTDQVFVYTLTNSNGGTWSVASRNMGPKINVSGPITKTFTTGANATVTIGANAMTGATGSAAGAAGVVPAPAAGDNTKFLRGDGTWATAGGGGASIPTVYLSDNGSLFQGSFANLLFPNNGFVLSASPISSTAGSNLAISEGDMIALLQSGCPIRVEGEIAQDGYASGCAGLITCSSTGAGAKFRLEFLGQSQYFAGTASVNSIDGTTGGVRWGWQQ